MLPSSPTSFVEVRGVKLPRRQSCQFSINYTVPSTQASGSSLQLTSALAATFVRGASSSPAEEAFITVAADTEAAFITVADVAVLNDPSDDRAPVVLLADVADNVDTGLTSIFTVFGFDFVGPSFRAPFETTTVSIRATDAAGNVDRATYTVTVSGTPPIASDDVHEISEGIASDFGNVTNDIVTGNIADDISDPVSSIPGTDIDFGAVDGTIGTPLAGTCGSLSMSNNGRYTYRLDNNNPAVQGLTFGDELFEVFAYTILNG